MPFIREMPLSMSEGISTPSEPALHIHAAVPWQKAGPRGSAAATAKQETRGKILQDPLEIIVTAN